MNNCTCLRDAQHCPVHYPPDAVRAATPSAVPASPRYVRGWCDVDTFEDFAAGYGNTVLMQREYTRTRNYPIGVVGPLSPEMVVVAMPRKVAEFWAAQGSASVWASERQVIQACRAALAAQPEGETSNG